MVEPNTNGHTESYPLVVSAVEVKQNQILVELEATVHAIENLNDVFDDLVVLTEPPPSSSASSADLLATSSEARTSIATDQDHDDDNNHRHRWSSSSLTSIAVKQQNLLDELHNWKVVLADERERTQNHNKKKRPIR